MNRRHFLVTGAATSILNSMPRFVAAQAATSAAPSLSLDTEATRIPVPADFTGLSYEAAQLANPGYFSASNKRLVTLVRQLGVHGVLRIGGNTSDFDQWKPEHAAHGAAWAEPVGPDAGLNIGKRTPVTESAIDELRTFLDATGWKLLYGIDLGHGSPDNAADEAAYVVKTIGPALLALQIGNEADLFFRNGIRTPTYGYADYFAEWQRFADAIRKRTPNAPLAGPDIGNHLDWVDQFAQQAQGIDMLTSHYYAEGPPSSPASDIGHLLKPHPGLVEHMQRMVAVGRAAHLPYRMSEGNSCYHGGKPGVSDSFASALWGADFMMLLAQLGVAGVNFHGGGQGFYTPIAGGGSKPLQARPLYYGMLFFREFAAGSLLPCKFETGGVNATAYACLASSGRLKLAIVNKDLSQDLTVELNGPAFSGPNRQLALRAPGAESTTNITLGGQSVSAQEKWQANFTPPRRDKTSPTRMLVPHTSAVLIEFEGVSL